MEDLFRLLSNEATGAGSDVKELRKSIDRLMIITRALWEIIAESQGLSGDELINKVDEIDLRDGSLDGKVKRPIRICVHCGKVLPLGRDGCLYCGAQNKGADLFQAVSIEPGEYLAQGIF